VIVGDLITNVALPTLTGAGEDGATITLFAGAAAIGSGLVTGGVWSVAATMALTPGLNILTARQTNLSGEVSGASTPLGVTLDILAPTIAPTITGTHTTTTTADAVVNPFSNAIVGDLNDGAMDELTITLSNAANGILSGTGLAGGTGGVYTLTGTEMAITSELEALLFTPTAGALGTVNTTGFGLSDQSSAFATPTTNNATTVRNTVPTSSILFRTPMGKPQSGRWMTRTSSAAAMLGPIQGQAGLRSEWATSLVPRTPPRPTFCGRTRAPVRPRSGK
jgi:hypothetical protein